MPAFIRRSAIPCTLLLGVLFVAACAGGPPAGDRNGAPPPSARVAPSLTSGSLDSSLRHQLALGYFTTALAAQFEGKALDASGALESALRYDDNATLHAALADVRLSLRDPAGAAVEMRRALELAPSNLHYLRGLAAIHLTGYAIDSAAALCAAVLARDSSDAEMLRALARLSEQQDPATALRCYERLASLNPRDAEALLRTGQLRAMRGDAAAAESAFRAHLALDPGSEAGLQGLAVLCAQTGRLSEALPLFDSLRTRRPDNHQYALMLAEALMMSGDWPRADAIFRPLADSASVPAEHRIRIGTIYLQQALRDPAQLPAARAVCASLCRAFPGDWRPQHALGVLLLQSDEVRQAVEAFERALLLSPGRPEVLEMLARAQSAAGDDAAAVETLNALAAVPGAPAGVWFLQAAALQRLGRGDEAVDAWKRGLERDPGNASAARALAVLLDERGATADAVALLDNAIARADAAAAKDGEGAALRNTLAWILVERGTDLERAHALSRAAIDAAPDNSAYLDTHGWVCFKLGRTDEALTLISRAVDLRMNQPLGPGAVLYEHLGDVYQALGRADAAMNCWRQALKADPRNELLRLKIRAASTPTSE